MRTTFRRGAVIVHRTDGGQIEIEAAHIGGEHTVIEPADADDLVLALADAMLSDSDIREADGTHLRLHIMRQAAELRAARQRIAELTSGREETAGWSGQSVGNVELRQGDLMALRVLVNDVAVAECMLPHPFAQVIGVNAHVIGRSRDTGEPAWISQRLTPWSNVEAIAAYVAGDGSDPQRLALADGIRSGRRDD